jgi:1-acyl-sn-glycerol-3-phosphate acyltransferase
MTARRHTAARSADSSSADDPLKECLKEGAGAAFYPPQQKPLMTRLVQSISDPLARILYKFRLSVSEEGIGRVRAVSDARLVFVCNHPTMEDGITLFVLSARLGMLLHYVVAYESFKGLMGWFIQRLGCYSIRRGMGDRNSISQSLALLKEPQCRLVIFPEGGCSYQNDTIMSLRPGAIQLPMSALAQLAKKARSPEQVPDLYVVPLSLKYRYQQPMHRIIESMLSRLESQLKISPAPAADNYLRLRQVAHQVIVRIETEADLPHEENLDWNQRIDRLKQVFIKNCEAALNIEPATNLPLRERVYKVQALLEQIPLEQTSLEKTALKQPSLKQTKDTQQERLSEPHQRETSSPQIDSQIASQLNSPELNCEALYWNTVRLLNFDAIYDGYVAESPTAERFLDTLTRLEREVFHVEHAQPKAPRKACFYIGEPINLKDYLADYQRDRSGTIDRLSEQIRQTMQNNLTIVASSENS